MLGDVYLEPSFVLRSARACVAAFRHSGVSTWLSQITNSQALYLRLHKQEMFLIQSVVGNGFVGLSTYFLGRRFSALSVVSGFLAVGLIVGHLSGPAYFKISKDLAQHLSRRHLLSLALPLAFLS